MAEEGLPYTRSAGFARFWRIPARAPILPAMKAKVPAALVGAALMAALLVGCPETTPIQDGVSRTFTLKSVDFVLRPNPDGQSAVASATYDMPEITANIVAAGTVAAEIDLGSQGTEWSALPLTLHFMDRSGAPHVVMIQPGYREGEFMLLLRADLQGTVAGMLVLNGYRLRAIIISGDAAGDG